MRSEGLVLQELGCTAPSPFSSTCLAAHLSLAMGPWQHCLLAGSPRPQENTRILPRTVTMALLRVGLKLSVPRKVPVCE